MMINKGTTSFEEGELPMCRPEFGEESMPIQASKWSRHTPIVTGALILVALLQVIAFGQTYQQCTISNGTATGFFGGYNISGTFTQGANPNTSNITVAGAYTYTFTGPLDGPGYTQTSKIPPPPCDILGCTPGETVAPGVATLSVGEPTDVLASLGFEDTGEIFTGYGTLSCQTVSSSSPPPPPESCGSADPIWSPVEWTGQSCDARIGTGGPITNAGYVSGQRINANWGKDFGVRTSLTSLLGQTLEVWCGTLPTTGEFQYFLFYTPPFGGAPHAVGYCTFENGCNFVYYSYSSVVQGPNGPAPACFESTTWISKDYGPNDSYNPITHEVAENPPLLDWFVSVFSAPTSLLLKTDFQFLYKSGQTAPMCPPKTPPEGKLVNILRQIDPPIGPATDAYALSIMNELASQPPGVAAGSNGASLADINGDGVVNMADFTAFQTAFGSCTGQPNYNIAADLDFDGCVTLKDYQIWLQLYNAATAK